MPKTIPIIIANDKILVKEKDSDKFVTYEPSGIENEPNIPFFHQFAKKISESQYYFKDFMKKLYGKKVNKYVLAIIVPDDTSALEHIFINEFFLHSDACKAVAQITMAQTLSKNHSRYISISRSHRNIVLDYIANGEILAQRLYDTDNYEPPQIIEDAKRIHIDVEYSGVPIFINNFNMNMDDFADLGYVITTKDFLDKIANVQTEKV